MVKYPLMLHDGEFPAVFFKLSRRLW